MSRDHRLRRDRSHGALLRILRGDTAFVGRLGFNTLSDVATIDGAPLDDAAVLRLRSQIVDRYSYADLGLRPMREAVLEVCAAGPFCPVRRHLEALRWDRKARLDALPSVFREWFLGAVSRTLDSAPQDRAVVFIGRDAGAVAAILAGPLGSEWLLAGPANTNRRLDRLLATLASTRAPRIVIGTSDGPLRPDDRIVQLRIGRSDVRRLTVDREQLFAEAVALYRLGERPDTALSAEDGPSIVDRVAQLAGTWPTWITHSEACQSVGLASTPSASDRAQVTQALARSGYQAARRRIGGAFERGFRRGNKSLNVQNTG